MEDQKDRKEHWEKIYSSKKLEEVSWYQPVPETSLEFIEESGLPLDASIIDIGGGDSFLVDHLLKKGYTSLSVLDISEGALERAKERLGEKSSEVSWIASDITAYSCEQPFDLWHDRAAFHFLTGEEDIRKYVKLVSDCIRPGGTLIIGTFSEEGPKKCSGIEIRQYNEHTLKELFADNFIPVACKYVDHPTPMGTVQNFVFCSFDRR